MRNQYLTALKFLYRVTLYLPSSGQPKVIIWTILVLLQYPMLHIKFQGNKVQEFYRLLPWIGMGPCWSCDLDCFAQLKESVYEILLQLAQWLLRRCLKSSNHGSPGSKVKQWPYPLVLTNLHVLIKLTLITNFRPKSSNLFMINPRSSFEQS